METPSSLLRERPLVPLLTIIPGIKMVVVSVSYHPLKRDHHHLCRLSLSLERPWSSPLKIIDPVERLLCIIMPLERLLWINTPLERLLWIIMSLERFLWIFMLFKRLLWIIVPLKRLLWIIMSLERLMDHPTRKTFIVSAEHHPPRRNYSHFSRPLSSRKNSLSSRKEKPSSSIIDYHTRYKNCHQF